MRGELILHILHISGTSMIESGIYGLYRGNNIEGKMRGLDPLQFVSLGKGDIEISDNLDIWLRSWWGDTLMPLYAMVWFEEEQR